MKKFIKGPFIFVLYHLFFAAAILTVSILGVTLINYVFMTLGLVIALIGVLSFFVGLDFVFGIYDSAGNEYYATNFRYKLILSFSILIIAAAVAYIPEYVDVPEFLVGVFIALLAWIVGSKMMTENCKWDYDLAGFTYILGKAVPVSYILCVGVLIVSLSLGFPPVVLIIVSSISALIHLIRIVLVLKDNPF